MAKKMLIDATHAEETRVVVVDGNKVEEFDFESENKRQLAGNIYLAKVTRVEPSLQAAFVDYGGNRHGFLAFSEIHPDYYQIPVADREALLEEERAYAESIAAKDEEEREKPKRRSRRSTKAEEVKSDDEVATKDVAGMDVIDLDEGGDTDEAQSPMETVPETPVEEPSEDTQPAEGDASDDTSDNGVSSDEDDSDESDDDNARRSRSRRGRSRRPRGRKSDDDGDDDKLADAAAKDDSIESVADDDDHDDIRPPRKPRPRKYKIQEVIKVRQILLVQVVKEERGNKGAALTTYLSLAGRYCVLMPNTARGGGISRKITNAVDRKKLKEIAGTLEVPQGAGLIVRTAGAKRTKSEIKRDYEYLQRMWEQIRELTLKSSAPAKIYEEGDLIKRSIRDLYNREIDEVLVEGEAGYREAKAFMKMIMPSHAKNVKHYHDDLPLFARYQVESYLSSMFNPTVQLKSGGYIVIGVTEALVAIDVNSGRATKEGSIEETALKTNLEAAEEVARQLRLRDLAGLIVIDFIDMEERKNNNAVEKRIKDKLKTDRARIQVGRISGFGLLEMSRQRLRPGMIEATTQPCAHCHGTGLVRSDDNLALNILRQLEEEGTRGRSKEVLLKAPVAIVNYLMNQKREHIAQIEARYGISIRLEADPFLISPDYEIEKFKTASRVVERKAAPVVTGDASFMEDLEDEVEVEEDEAPAAEEPQEAQNGDEAADGDEQPKKKRRRRRRGGRGRGRKKTDGENGEENGDTNGETNGSDEAPSEDAKEEVTAEATTPEGTPEETPAEKPKRTRSRKKKSDDEAAETTPDEASTEEPKKKVTRSRKKASDKAAAEADADTVKDGVDEKKDEKPKRKRAPRKKASTAPVDETAVEEAAEAPVTPEPVDAVVDEVTPDAAGKTFEPEVATQPDVPEPALSEEVPEPLVPGDVEDQAPEVVEDTGPVEDDNARTPEMAEAAEVAEEKSKPKRRGWWSR